MSNGKGKEDKQNNEKQESNSGSKEKKVTEKLLGPAPPPPPLLVTSNDSEGTNNNEMDISDAPAPPNSTTATSSTTISSEKASTPRGQSRKRHLEESGRFAGGCTECRKVGKFAPYRKTSHNFCCGMHHKHAPDCPAAQDEGPKRRRLDPRNRLRGGPGRASSPDKRNISQGGPGRKIDRRNKTQGGPGRYKHKKFEKKNKWIWKPGQLHNGVRTIECHPMPTETVVDEKLSEASAEATSDSEKGKEADSNADPKEDEEVDSNTEPKEGKEADSNADPKEGKEADSNENTNKGKEADSNADPKEGKEADSNADPKEDEEENQESQPTPPTTSTTSSPLTSIATPTLKPLIISRIICGLWQVADMEREGGIGLNQEEAVSALTDVHNAGICTFDMADHYGSAEQIFGNMQVKVGEQKPNVSGLTKWVPKPGATFATAEAIDEAVKLAASRMQLKTIPILQLHTWDYLDGPGTWLTQLRHLAAHPQVERVGLTNFDTAHLCVAVAEGIPVATNQVCISLLDSRALQSMSELCLECGVRLLAFGVLAGGLLTDRYHQKPEPTEADLAKSWSLAKYRRFVDSFGGWALFQELLTVLRQIADRHVVNHRPISIANVASRWVLEQPAVASIIVGIRPGHSNHTVENKTVFKFSLSVQDKQDIDQILTKANAIHGDCGDEYRTPPFLTASGDLSDHLDQIPNAYKSIKLPGHTEEKPRLRVSTGTHWEEMAGYSRGVRFGNRVCISGTTATDATGAVVGGRDAGAQTTYCLDIIEASLKSLGAKLSDVVRTRIFVKNIEDWPLVAKAHGKRFCDHQPSNTLVQANIVGKQYLVEVEAEAEIMD